MQHVYMKSTRAPPVCFHSICTMSVIATFHHSTPDSMVERLGIFHICQYHPTPFRLPIASLRTHAKGAFRMHWLPIAQDCSYSRVGRLDRFGLPTLQIHILRKLVRTTRLPHCNIQDSFVRSKELPKG